MKTQNWREKLLKLLVRCRNVFTRNEKYIGWTSLVLHGIDTGNASPVKQALRRKQISIENGPYSFKMDLKF